MNHIQTTKSNYLLIFLFLLITCFIPTQVGAKKSEKINSCSILNKTPELLLPVRRKGAISGSQFIKKISKLSKEKRELAILTEIRHGNIPSFLRKLKPINLQHYYPEQNQTIKATIWVTSDYLGIGSDTNWVRIPMTPQIAQNIADHAGAILPTQKIVDEIWKQANIQIKPRPLPERGDSMRSPELFLRHNLLVNSDLTKSTPSTKRVVIAGHKKDLIITNRISKNPGHVAIYGWHSLNGSPIQPISLVHNDKYSDYSHGVRLVSIVANIEGNFVYLDDMLRSQLSWIVSDEGKLATPAAYIGKDLSLKRLSHRSLAERLKLSLEGFFKCDK